MRNKVRKSIAIIFLALVAFVAGIAYIKYTGCDCRFKTDNGELRSSEITIVSQCQTSYNHFVDTIDEDKTDEYTKTNSVTIKDTTTCGINCHCVVTYGDNLIDATLPMVEKPDCNTLKNYQCNEGACRALCKQFVLKYFGKDK